MNCKEKSIKTKRNIITIKRSNKLVQALNLPTIVNINPRSIYNKSDEFSTFVKEEEADVIFISESFERENLPLQQVINLEDYTVISNVSQRKEVGGRPALVVNNKKFQVQNVTNTLVQIPWGVEAVWCVLTPNNVTQDSKIKKIACCAFYSKPKSRMKSQLNDHFSEAYNVLNLKYGSGLHFLVAGDSNDFKLNTMLSLSPNLVQVVKDWTRMNPPAILDPVIMTLAEYYQEPMCLDPLDADPDKKGKKSDHRIVVVRPKNVLNNKSTRETRQVKVRPYPESGIKKMKDWFIDKSWMEVTEAVTAHDKAEVFQKILIDKLDEIFPEKVRTFSSDDQPWMSHKLKKIDRRRKRIFHKERRSEKWKNLDKLFKIEVKAAKAKFYSKSVADLKNKKPHQWYSALKRITSHDQHKRKTVNINEINHLSNQDQAEMIADQFASIPNEYSSLQSEDVVIPVFSEDDIPQFEPFQVWFFLSKIATNKATVPGDFPAKLIKLFAAYLAEPLTDIINTSIKRGEYPTIYKFEVSTPVPKTYPPEKISQMRNISGLLNFDKIMEKLISQLMISDMETNMDPTQYGNQRGVSIQHYLINMIHRILTVLDNNKRRETFAVIANLIDWNNAFPRQCPKLGIDSFIKNGVRPALVPVLVNYFQDRQMSVKWHGCTSVPRHIKGGGPQGATLGILEYLAQSNNNADCVNQEDRFKFVDDLSILEIVNLLTVGLTSFNMKYQVSSDIPNHNQYIPAENLKSQTWLDKINQWTVDQKMLINEKKTKAVIFNYTDNYQFTTRLQLNNQNVEIINSTKLLGTIVQNDLKWNKNTDFLVKKANARMELLRRVASFGAPVKDLKEIYILFVRSLLEQSATVWHSSITEENANDLERVQKSALKIILQDNYKSYRNALNLLDMETLVERRDQLCLNFALKCVQNKKTKSMFPLNQKDNQMNKRHSEKYKVQHANTARLQKFSIIYMQNMLNDHEEKHGS